MTVEAASRWRRLGAEVALYMVAGLLMAVLGPYETSRLPVYARLVYWLICIVGGGLIGTVVDTLVGRLIGAGPARVLASSFAMTPPVSLLVLTTSRVLAGQRFGWPIYLDLLWQVFAISLPLMAVRALVWRRPVTLVETRTVIAAPLPEAEAAFRRRLSARRRTARLIALEAHDHYLRVHTGDGVELVTARFADALADLSGAHGFRTHRSWWVAADAVEAVRWRRGAGEAVLTGGLIAPVSRAHAATLKEAGWF